jgi:hypothetical protein
MGTNIVTILRSTGSVLAKKKSSKKLVLTEKKSHDIDTRLEAIPRKSLCLLALHCSLARSTAHVGT